MGKAKGHGAESKKARGRRIHSTGRRGQNRVWLSKLERGSYLMQWVDHALGGGRRSERLTLTLEEAKKRAEAKSAQLLVAGPPIPVPPPSQSGQADLRVGNLAWVIEGYLDHVRGKLSPEELAYRTTTLEMAAKWFGAHRMIEDLETKHLGEYRKARGESSQPADIRLFPELKDAGLLPRQGGIQRAIIQVNGKEVSRLVPPVLFPKHLRGAAEERAAGRATGRGWRWPAPVRDRALERESRTIVTALRWGVKALRKHRSGAAVFCDLAEMRVQRTPVPETPRFDGDKLNRILGRLDVAPKDLVDLVHVAHETGRRLRAILGLLTSDVMRDGEGYQLRWREEADKMGKASTVPLTKALGERLFNRCNELGFGAQQERLLFPRRDRHGVIVGRGFTPWSPDHARACLRKAFEAAEVEWVNGSGFHMFRRLLASDHGDQDVPLVVTMAIGGWSSPEVIVTRYQRVKQSTLQRHLDSRSLPPGASAPSREEGGE